MTGLTKAGAEGGGGEPWKILLNVAENLGVELQGTESHTLEEIFSLHSAVLLVIAVIGGSLHTHSFPELHGLFSGSVPITICHYLQHTAILCIFFPPRFWKSKRV